MKKIDKKAIAMLLLLAGSVLVPVANGMEVYNSKQHRNVSYKETEEPETVTKTYPVETRKESDHEFYARITTYWARGGDTDGWSKHHESATGDTLEEGVSAAVDPNLIPFGSDIIIPGWGRRKAQDTGSAVIHRCATHGTMPVIDVFFDTKQEALDYAENHPQIVKITYQ